jgi:GMP synthase (glutamine-hydrolysing)
MLVGIVYHTRQTTGRLDDALAAAGVEVARFRVGRDGSVPVDAGLDAAVILGGEMGAYEEDRHPWLAEEKVWLRKLVEDGKPVLGICLGAQMLADALGGRAYGSPEGPEVGVLPLELTPAGEDDPVLREAGKRVFELHQDTFDLPPEAVLLAESHQHPQAFRLGSALAIQFHPDGDAAQAIAWAEEDGPLLARAGVSLEDFAAQLTEAEPELDRNSRALFRAWVEEL